MIKKIVDKYANFVSHNPLLMVGIVIIISIIAAGFASNVETKSEGYSNMIPDNYDVIKAFNILEDNFGGSDSAMVAIFSEPKHKDSNEYRDLRSHEVIDYINLLTQQIEHVESVTSVTSASTILKSLNNGILPKTNREIKKNVESPLFLQYINKDYSISIIRFNLADDYDANELEAELNDIIENTDTPIGLTVRPAGDVLSDPIVEREIGPDMGKTSQISIIGILLVLIILFRSIKYSLTPLSVIGIGILWAFGFMGLMSINLSPSTSGVISMIMGIGIDFGIQIVTRFREELETHKASIAMKNTLSAVLIPMATTTIAALIGFKAMSMGELTMMGEFGQIMSYGVGACFLVAITLVPALLVLAERILPKKEDHSKRRKKFKSPKNIVRSIRASLMNL